MFHICVFVVLQCDETYACIMCVAGHGHARDMVLLRTGVGEGDGFDAFNSNNSVNTVPTFNNNTDRFALLHFFSSVNKYLYIGANQSIYMDACFHCFVPSLLVFVSACLHPATLLHLESSYGRLV